MSTKKENNDLIARAIMGTPITVFLQDNKGVIIWVANPQSGWTKGAIVGKRNSEIFDHRNASLLDAAKAVAKASGEDQTIVVEATQNSRAQWFKIVIKPVKDKEDHTNFLCSCIEITNEREREETLRALLLEVSHRSKNMLSVVLSIAAQTAKTARNPELFLRRFTGRVQSLAKSQDVIVNSEWVGATLQELINRQVLGLNSEISSQIIVEGDNPQLSPNGATHVGLALHELYTNSITFGALSVPEGKIAISCSKTVIDGIPSAQLIWDETPRVTRGAAPEKSFGRTALEQIVPSAVNGKGKLSVDSDGVRYSLTIGGSELVG
tara:strand:- start:4618 stop:5586 length:969 start_codon:yes stop_codon:yes gene_type:complete